MKQLLAAAIALACARPPLPGAGGEPSGLLDNWHRWRGPLGNGTAPRGDPPVRWGEDRNVRRKTEVPGEGHASPVVWGDQVFENGELIWQCGGQTENPIPSPAAAGGVVFCRSGFRGHSAVAIPLDSRGDLTGTDHVLWRLDRGTPYVPSPVLVDGRLYFTSANQGILTVVEARTGKPAAEGMRLEGLKTVYASPVAGRGRLYLIDRDGTAVVLGIDGKPEVLAANRVDDSFSATPAVSGRQLFLRGSRHVYCLEEQAPADR